MCRIAKIWFMSYLFKAAQRVYQYIHQCLLLGCMDWCARVWLFVVRGVWLLSLIRCEEALFEKRSRNLKWLKLEIYATSCLRRVSIIFAVCKFFFGCSDKKGHYCCMPKERTKYLSNQCFYICFVLTFPSPHCKGSKSYILYIEATKHQLREASMVS